MLQSQAYAVMRMRMRKMMRRSVLGIEQWYGGGQLVSGFQQPVAFAQAIVYGLST